MKAAEKIACQYGFPVHPSGDTSAQAPLLIAANPLTIYLSGTGRSRILRTVEAPFRAG